MPFAVPVSPLATILFMALALVMFAFVVRAARRSSAGEGSSRRNDRSRIGIIIQGVGIGIAGFGPIHGILPALSPVSIAQCLVVLLLMLGAIRLFASSSRALGRNWSLVARTRTDHELVRRGPYARIRHPIYLGLLLFLLALACAFGHWALVGYGFWTVEEKGSSARLGELGFLDVHRDIVWRRDGAAVQLLEITFMPR